MAGRRFAARHAECVFITGLTPKMTAGIVSDIREKARAEGRDPASIIIYTAMTVIVAPTDEEAQSKLEEYKRYVSIEGTLTLYGGYSGIDFSGYDLDTPVGYVESNAIQTFVECFSILDPDRTWTLRQIAEFLGIGGFAPIITGSPQTVATELEQWMEESDVDGFNIVYAVSPGDLEDFVDMVVPELQARSSYRTAYPPGTFREKLYGAGQARLRADHPGIRFRQPSTSHHPIPS
jgi:alkanesulfonate monooxygenase SsuD/methylene tetrahydromethanopterin reductase-like flavin-dependent oxidoreductase (luciferase family)